MFYNLTSPSFIEYLGNAKRILHRNLTSSSKSLRDRYYYYYDSHFTDEENEAQNLSVALAGGHTAN